MTLTSVVFPLVLPLLVLSFPSLALLVAPQHFFLTHGTHLRVGNLNMKTRRGKSTLTAVSKVVKAEQRDTGDLEDVLSLAEYEIECDPYRGMNVADSTAASPWFECRHTKQDCGKVSQVCGCACRSLIRWTRDYDSKSKRTNRKQPVHHVHHLGRRREDPTYQCPCDHNPVSMTSS